MSDDMIKAIEAMGKNFKPMDTRQTCSETEEMVEEGIEFKQMLQEEMTKINNNEKSERKVERHMEVCKLLNDTYRKKNHDYGDSFGKTFRDWGVASAGIRISDKYNRFCSLAKGEQQMVNDEAIEDTLLDLANYCIMTYMEITK